MTRQTTEAMVIFFITSIVLLLMIACSQTGLADAEVLIAQSTPGAVQDPAPEDEPTNCRGQLGRGRWGCRGCEQGLSSRYFDAHTIKAVQGRITDVEMSTAQTTGRGVHLRLMTNQTELMVRLGPTWYLNEHGVRLQTGDEISVKGSQVMLAGQPTIIATELTQNNKTLILRDQDGFPRWRGWHQE